LFKRIIACFLVIVIIFSFAFSLTSYAIFPDIVRFAVLNFGDVIFSDHLHFTEYTAWLLDGRSGVDACPGDPDGGAHVWTSDIAIGTFTGYFNEHCMLCGITAVDYLSELEDAKCDELDSTVVSNIPAGKPYEITISASSSNYLINSSYKDATISFKLYSRTQVYTWFYFKVNHIGNYTFNIPTFTCLCGVDHTSTVVIYENYNGNSTSLQTFDNSKDEVCTAVLDPDSIYIIYYIISSSSLTAGNHILSLNFEPYLSGDLIHDTPETETRTCSLMQTINNYNVDNSVVDNSSNINYYISPKSYVTELPDDTIDIEQCYSPQSYDEETLVFTEPVTGAQILSSGWTYNYETRTYDIAVPAGTTTDTLGSDITRIELIYGDEAVTYNYYLADDTLAQSDEYAYVMVSGDETFGTGGSSGDDNTGDDTTGDADEETHKHSYTDTVTTEPTCEAPGIRKYTCDECGDSYTEKIDAAGHTWTVRQSVATEYDDTGAVTVQGYTIYKCSVCNTEYKDEAGTGPPNNSADNTDGEGIFKKIGQLLGSILSGLLGMIEAVLGGLLDGLVRLADLVGDKLTQVVEIVTGLFDKIPQLFGGFTSLLGDVFVFIPEDIMTIFTFGAAAIVFVGILMLFIKR